MLTYYITQTQRLLQNPGAPTTLYSTSDITNYINIIRGQLAADSECIHELGTISTTVGNIVYPFSSIVLNTSVAQGIAGVLNIQTIQYSVASGKKWLTPRPWPWFQLYHLNNPVPASGPPKTWAQFSQGSSGLGQITNAGAGTIRSGSFFIDPVPDIVYSLACDCICYPIALASDTDRETIPYEWTEAVPYGAAWYALLSSQTSARMAEAEKYLGYYQQFAARGRNASNPSVLRYQYPQQTNITLPNKVGISPSGSSGGGQ